VFTAKPPQARAPAIAFAALSLLCLWIALYELRRIDPLLLLTALAVVWLADIGAYFAGRRFGRHKLAPKVSPGKTREGAYGGLALVLAAALAVMLAAPHPAVMPQPLIAGYGLVITLLVLCLIVALSVVGDLYESLLKRGKGVKDSGALFPGHGGILDRIDALVPTMPAFLLLLQMTSP
jgi:phosphatidate cytidylyltransferase